MTTDNPWNLSPAQIKALEAVIRHGGDKGAARALGLTYNTVAVHMQAVRAKMGDHTIGCCVAWAKWRMDDEDETL